MVVSILRVHPSSGGCGGLKVSEVRVLLLLSVTLTGEGGKWNKASAVACARRAGHPPRQAAQRAAPCAAADGVAQTLQPRRHSPTCYL